MGAVYLDWVVEYYQKENGEIPIEDFLLTLNPKLHAKAYSENKFVLLHGFVKKVNKPPERELDRALIYKLDYERKCQDE